MFPNSQNNFVFFGNAPEVLRLELCINGGMILTGRAEELAVQFCPSVSLSTTNPKLTGPETNTDLRGEKPALQPVYLA